MIKTPRLLRLRFHKHVWSHFPRKCVASPHPVTILIPLAVKDIENARLCVAALRRHLRHPITEIVVAGQDNALIRTFCRDESLRYLNENEVLPKIALNNPYMLQKTGMNGWLRQQFLKLAAFSYLEADRIITQDSDTFLVRDMSYMTGEQQICYLADEYTPQFYHFPKMLLGSLPRHPRSFVAHAMLWQRDLVAGLDRQVQASTGLGLIETILAHLDHSNDKWLSEFEIYGNYLHHFHPDRFVTRYWYNVKLPAGPLPALEWLEQRYRRFNSVSAHIH